MNSRRACFAFFVQCLIVTIMVFPVYAAERDKSALTSTKKVVRNTVVTLDYQVTDEGGSVVDDGKKPLVYLHGDYRGIFPILEEAVHGKAQGSNIRVKTPPDEAFGNYDKKLVVTEPRSKFPSDLKVGMVFERVEEKSGEENLFRVVSISPRFVVLDGNHPLAGRTLLFDLYVRDVRPATESEILHKRVEPSTKR